MYSRLYPLQKNAWITTTSMYLRWNFREGQDVSTIYSTATPGYNNPTLCALQSCHPGSPSNLYTAQKKPSWHLRDVKAFMPPLGPVLRRVHRQHYTTMFAKTLFFAVLAPAADALLRFSCSQLVVERLDPLVRKPQVQN